MPIELLNSQPPVYEIADGDAGTVSGTTFVTTLVTGSANPMTLTFVAPPSGRVHVEFGAWMGLHSSTTAASGNLTLATRITGGHHPVGGTVYGDHTQLFSNSNAVGYPGGNAPSAGAALPAPIAAHGLYTGQHRSYEQTNLEPGVSYTITVIMKTSAATVVGYIDSRYLRVLPVQSLAA